MFVKIIFYIDLFSEDLIHKDRFQGDVSYENLFNKKWDILGIKKR